MIRRFKYELIGRWFENDEYKINSFREFIKTYFFNSLILSGLLLISFIAYKLKDDCQFLKTITTTFFSLLLFNFFQELFKRRLEVNKNLKALKTGAKSEKDQEYVLNLIDLRVSRIKVLGRILKDIEICDLEYPSIIKQINKGEERSYQERRKLPCFSLRDIKNVSFEHWYLNNSVLYGISASFVNMSLENVIFNCELINFSVEHCRFKNCRFYFEKILEIKCYSKLKNKIPSLNVLNELKFTVEKLKDVEFYNCEFYSVNFTNVNVTEESKGVKFINCVFKGRCTFFDKIILDNSYEQLHGEMI